MRGIFSHFHKKVIGDQSLRKRTQYVLSVSIIIFAVAVAIAILILNIRSRHERDIRESESIINSITGSITANIDTYKDLSRLIMINPQVIKFLRAEEIDPGLRNDTKYAVMDIVNVCNGMDSVFVIRNDKEYINTGRGEYDVRYGLMESAKWMDKFIILRGGALVTMNGNNAIFRNDKRPIISIGRAIYDINTQKRVGVLQFNVSTNMLNTILFNQSNADVAIFSDDGTFLAGSENLIPYFSEEYISPTLVNEVQKYGKERRMVSGQRVADFPLIAMCAPIPQSSIVPSETVYILLLILGSFVISISISGIFVSRNITGPINQLSSEIEATKESDFLKELEIDLPKNELGQLADNYNIMVKHLRETIDELIEKEKSIQKAEMSVLNEQLKPHFLYNSLETISFMAYDAGAMDVFSALETLGSFYRNFLSKGNREITLRTEINIIKDYLALQKLRYGDIIMDEYDIAEETMDIRIPKLILQPLVENSIYHGIRMTGEPGIIRVTTRMIGCDLHITVYDTGVGMPEDIIKSVLNGEMPDNPSGDPKHSSFGLKGTIERIRYSCNRDDIISIRSEIGEFTEVEITIPDVIKNSEGENVQSNAD